MPESRTVRSVREKAVRDFPAPGIFLVTAYTLQGMARIRSGQAPAWPSVSDRRGCGSAVKGDRRAFPEETNAKRP